MERTSVQYIVDGDGKKIAVVLPVEAFDRLVEHLEDLEDALALDRAAAEVRDFTSYEEIRRELKEEGRKSIKSEA